MIMIGARSVIALFLLYFSAAKATYGDDTAGLLRGQKRRRQVESLTLSRVIGSEWEQLGVDIIGQNADDSSGNAVAMNGDGTVVAVAARVANSAENGHNAGHVRVFKMANEENSSWKQMGKTIHGESSNDRSGYEVSMNLEGTVVAISARFNDGSGGTDSGHVRVYKYDEALEDWTKMGGDLDGLATSSWLESVALDGQGTRVVIGASRHPVGKAAGEVRVYQYNDGADEWEKVGQTLEGTSSFDYFGGSVDIANDGTIIAVGSHAQDCTDDESNSNCGSAKVFQYSEGNGVWEQMGPDIMGQGPKSEFGGHLSLSGDGRILAVGASRHGAYAGQVQIFQYIANEAVGEAAASSWIQVGQNIDGEDSNDRSGSSIALSNDGSIVAIGAWGNDSPHGTNSGHVRVYGYVPSNNEWIKLGRDLDGEAGSNGFGWAVAVNGDGTRIIAGSPDRAGADNSYRGGARVYTIDIGQGEATPAPSRVVYESTIGDCVGGFLSRISRWWDGL